MNRKFAHKTQTRRDVNGYHLLLPWLSTSSGILVLNLLHHNDSTLHSVNYSNTQSKTYVAFSVNAIIYWAKVTPSEQFSLEFALDK